MMGGGGGGGGRGLGETGITVSSEGESTAFYKGGKASLYQNLSVWADTAELRLALCHDTSVVFQG